MSILRIALFFFIIAFFPSESFATLTCNNGENLNVTISGNYTLQKDAAPGLISAWNNVSWNSWLSCWQDVGGVIELQVAASTNPTSSTIVVDGVSYPVYSTNISGVGYIMKSQANLNDSNGYTSGWTGLVAAPVSTGRYNLFGWDSTVSQWFYGSYSIYVALVKYGPSGTGALQTKTIANVYFGDGSNKDGKGDVVLNLSGSITTLQCTVSTPSLILNMGDVASASFAGAGTYTSLSSPKNIETNCDANTNISLSLVGEQNEDMPGDASVLKLSGQGQPGVASGVGVQIMSGNTPLKLNQPIGIMSSAGGATSLPISARYIQTKDKVTAGSANATATLNITYQ